MKFPPGSMKDQCSWTDRKLTIKREKYDRATGTSSPTTPMNVDAGAYCDATSTPIADVGFPFVATVVSMNRDLGVPGKAPSYMSLALAAARCPHWGTGTHAAAWAPTTDPSSLVGVAVTYRGTHVHPHAPHPLVDLCAIDRLEQCCCCSHRAAQCPRSQYHT